MLVRVNMSMGRAECAFVLSAISSLLWKITNFYGDDGGGKREVVTKLQEKNASLAKKCLHTPACCC